jgi:PAS domain S-box-containing protein
MRLQSVNVATEMADFAEASTDGGARRFFVRWNRKFLRLRSPATRYGFAIACVAVALGLALGSYSLEFRDVGLVGLARVLLVLAVVLAAWYAGTKPAVVAVVLATASYDFFFTEPYYSFAISWQDLPSFLVFVIWLAGALWFVTVRRRIEIELRTACDRLEHEVTQRTQQARLLDQTHDTIFVRDMNGVITYWNRGAQELYGWSAQDAIDKKSQELLGTVFPGAAANVHDALLGRDRWEGELIETKADGTQVVVASRWSLRRDDQGQPAAVLVTNNDITARKHREEEIVALNRELFKRTEDLGAANKELEAFAYSVSHDLRAPVRHVIGYAELLQKQASSSLDEKSQRYMKTILESAKRMGALIDDLLAFSRIGRADTNKTTVDLGQLVREIIAELRPQIGDRDIAWNLDDLPACHGDRAMLKIAVVNLISNAVKFSRHRARAEIAIGSTEAQRNQIEVFVRDNGAGFDMRHANKLFGVFQRLHLSEEFEGTGIGLATVQRIIHRHGGNVRAEGGVDRGATFYFSLPR